MKAYHIPFILCLDHEDTSFDWKTNWFFYCQMECSSSPLHSENEPSWKLFLPCYVQIKPDQIVTALDKCHSIQWSRVVSLISLGGGISLFCLLSAQQIIFPLSIFQHSAPYPAARFEALSPLHSNHYLYSQLKSKTEIYFLSSYRTFFPLFALPTLKSSEAQNSLPLALHPNM